ncbi:uncharacterized protein LACBIDRAFT_303139 [Laccaria bicolor S238N-H82]|uniref:Predicted protein n=1 Tax=Laccaria bicolor (strain S238N-H82 / ATCC MYA-4686) TaxID=486041 RepID=B0DJ07_LACBS|nr:uncharacterized protein LACBIDRAFT_303139 [Laccaria bicolor S238N-H82]EDR05324.1 predicted protein [Laccaria bicolor S238N-H82]|eukprot:XP_001883882.1 predicted protein [Laccaria bicolor S238N-H82]
MATSIRTSPVKSTAHKRRFGSFGAFTASGQDNGAGRWAPRKYRKWASQGATLTQTCVPDPRTASSAG